MPITVYHSFVSPVVDAGNPNEVSPNDWNAAHTVTGAAEVTAQTRNRIVNGAMQHSQETGGALSTSTSYFVADQWQWNHNINAMNIALVSTSPYVTPNGSINTANFSVSNGCAIRVLFCMKSK